MPRAARRNTRSAFRATRPSAACTAWDRASTACSIARPASSTDFRYSPALKRSGITWTAQTLDTFIADPQKTVPANRMPYAGMPDAGDRADLIAYMRKAFR